VASNLTATPAAADGSTFSSSFTRIVDALKASKLGQRAPDVLRGLVQTIFQDSPNLRFATPYGPMEMSAGEFFTQPAEVQDALKGSVIDPTRGPQQGLEVSQQGTDGSRLATSPDAPARTAPVTTVVPEGQAASEGALQSDAADTPAASTPATNPPDSPAPTDTGAAGTAGGQTATEDSGPLKAYMAPPDTPATVKRVYRKMNPDEKAYKKELEEQGHEVIRNPEGEGKSIDFTVDSKLREYKKVRSNGPTSIKNQIEKAYAQVGAGEGEIVIDARESEATMESAESQIHRAAGKLGENTLKGRVTVMTKSGDVKY